MANMTSSVSASQVAGELASATFEDIPALVEHYREDPRQQVIKACERALKRHAKELGERERVNGMYELMHEKGFPVLKNGTRLVVPREKFREWVEQNVGK